MHLDKMWREEYFYKNTFRFRVERGLTTRFNRAVIFYRTSCRYSREERNIFKNAELSAIWGFDRMDFFFFFFFIFPFHRITRRTELIHLHREAKIGNLFFRPGIIDICVCVYVYVYSGISRQLIWKIRARNQRPRSIANDPC